MKNPLFGPDGLQLDLLKSSEVSAGTTTYAQTDHRVWRKLKKLYTQISISKSRSMRNGRPKNREG